MERTLRLFHQLLSFSNHLLISFQLLVNSIQPTILISKLFLRFERSHDEHSNCAEKEQNANKASFILIISFNYPNIPFNIRANVLYVIKEQLYILVRKTQNMEESDTKNLTLTHSLLVLNTIEKMLDCHARGDVERYFAYLEDALQLEVHYIDPAVRQAIQKDFELFRNKARSIKESNDHEESKKKKILDLKMDFAESHKFFALFALNRVGLVKLAEEGTIDFKSTDFDSLKRVIRDSGAGTETKLIEVLTKKEEKNTGSASGEGSCL